MATDPLQGGSNPGDDLVNKLAPGRPGAHSSDDHDVSGPPSAETIKRGYEEDVYDTKTVLSVPALVILFFVLAFGTVTVLFSLLAHPAADPNANPQALARNDQPLNNRLGRIGRGKEVDQPRLEPLRQRTGNARAITRPEVSEPGANSPELHPEDLIPTRERYPALFASGSDRVGIDKTLALSNDALKALFKSSGPALPGDASQHAPSGSNAGRGAGVSTVETPNGAAPKTPVPDKGKGGHQ